MRSFIPIMEPDLSGNEKKYLNDALDSGWISSKGKYVERLEDDLAKYHSTKFVLAVSNGTVALHLGLLSLGIGKGDEVIVPNLTFASSINTIIHCGAEPVIAEVDESTFNLDCDKLESYITAKTKAIMVVHLYGNPCNMSAINDIALRHNLYVVEDSAEALGSTYQNLKVGAIGDIGTFSFFGNKTITTGEGGAILFKEREKYEYAKVLRDHGMSVTKRYWHEHVGYNYRLTNLQAAVGCAQLERISQFLTRKNEIVNRYTADLAKIDRIHFQKSERDATNSYWLFTLVFEQTDVDDLADYLLQKGIETRRVFFPLSDMPVYEKYARGKYPVAEKISTQGLSLPSFPALKDKEVEYIVDSIHSYYES